jgi:hypothetical protein
MTSAPSTSQGRSRSPSPSTSAAAEPEQLHLAQQQAIDDQQAQVFPLLGGSPAAAVPRPLDPHDRRDQLSAGGLRRLAVEVGGEVRVDLEDSHEASVELATALSVPHRRSR